MITSFLFVTLVILSFLSSDTSLFIIIRHIREEIARQGGLLEKPNSLLRAPAQD